MIPKQSRGFLTKGPDEGVSLDLGRWIINRRIGLHLIRDEPVHYIARSFRDLRPIFNESLNHPPPPDLGSTAARGPGRIGSLFLIRAAPFASNGSGSITEEIHSSSNRDRRLGSNGHHPLLPPDMTGWYPWRRTSPELAIRDPGA